MGNLLLILYDRDNMNNKEKHFSWVPFLLTLSFFVVAVIVGMLVTSAARKETDTWFMPLLSGAFFGFLCSWITFFLIAQFYIWLRGGPFHVGDEVEITCGQYKGKTGKVMMADKEQGILKVDIGIKSNEIEDEYFTKFEVRKLHR